MTKPLLKIFGGVIILFIFIYTGLPFEINDPLTESIFRILSFSFIFFLIFLLFKQTRKIIKKEIRTITYALLGFLTFLFTIGALWNNIWISEKNERNTYYNLAVYTNQSGTKILSQVRETSGSIFDYRDRLVIYEFDQNNRISININMEHDNNEWTIVNVEK